MIREYALEPAILSSWKDFRYFTEKFSIPQGRLISQYPTDWKRHVYEACRGESDINKHRITEKLNIINSRLLKRTRPYNQAHEWIDNTVQAHTERPFHAIVARTARPDCNHVVAAEALGSEHPLWNDCHSMTVKRKAADLAAAAATLLEISDQIIFIDPYFSPTSGNSRKPLSLYLKSITHRPGNLPSLVELHTGDHSKGTNPARPYADFCQGCQKHLSSLIPSGMSVKFRRWQQPKLHNRFILTDLGVLQFGTGLAEATTTGTRYDQVTLLDESVRQYLWKLHVTEPALSDLADNGRVVTVTGTAQNK